jgi:hypothetical protein
MTPIMLIKAGFSLGLKEAAFDRTFVFVGVAVDVF